MGAEFCLILRKVFGLFYQLHHLGSTTVCRPFLLQSIFTYSGPRVKMSARTLPPMMLLGIGTPRVLVKITWSAIVSKHHSNGNHLRLSCSHLCLLRWLGAPQFALRW